MVCIDENGEVEEGFDIEINFNGPIDTFIKELKEDVEKIKKQNPNHYDFRIHIYSYDQDDVEFAIMAKRKATNAEIIEKKELKQLDEITSKNYRKEEYFKLKKEFGGEE